MPQKEEKKGEGQFFTPKPSEAAEVLYKEQQLIADTTRLQRISH